MSRGCHTRKRILVTGGAGFIGSHLCERLLAEGHDITFPLFVEVDEIYNLACPASPIHYQNDPVQTTKTSEVYGDPAMHPQQEPYWGNVNPIGPRACYDEGKRCAETLFFDYHRQHALDIKVVRIFNTYGPRMHAADGRVVSNFIVQALQGHDITIFGDGLQTRSFCYVDDLIEGFLRFMEAGPDVHGPINLGNPNEFTIRELAEAVIAQTGSRSQLVTMPLPADDPTQRKPDTSIAQAKLGGWAPTVELEEGLRRTIAYFATKLGIDPAGVAAVGAGGSASSKPAPVGA